MLPRVRPETHYDENGHTHVKYTGVWATRQLGTIPANHVDYEAHVEAKNSYENVIVFLFLAFVELCCALALLVLGVYHWAGTNQPYEPGSASLLTVTGIAATWVSFTTVIAFWPGRSARITKRLVLVFSIVALYLLAQQIQFISARIAYSTFATQKVNGYYIAEVTLASIIAILIVLSLYPASEAILPRRLQQLTGIRAIALFLNTIVGAEILIYLCFSIYGINDAFMGDEQRINLSLPLVTTAIPVTSLMLLVISGNYYALGWRKRPHVVPYVVVGIVTLIIFLTMTQPYINFLTYESSISHEWSDDAFVAMFALNWISIFGIAITMSLVVAYAFM